MFIVLSPNLEKHNQTLSLKQSGSCLYPTPDTTVSIFGPLQANDWWQYSAQQDKEAKHSVQQTYEIIFVCIRGKGRGVLTVGGRGSTGVAAAVSAKRHQMGISRASLIYLIVVWNNTIKMSLNCTAVQVHISAAIFIRNFVNSDKLKQIIR